MKKFNFLFMFLLVASYVSAQESKFTELKNWVENQNGVNQLFSTPSKVKLDTVSVLKNGKIALYFSRSYLRHPVREAEKEIILNQVVAITDVSPKKIELYVGHSKDSLENVVWVEKGYPYAPEFTVDELIPNFYSKKIDQNKTYFAQKKKVQHVKNISLPTSTFTAGLAYKHIALWGSHGWYYENELSRWEWQRARNYQTVEDLYPSAFVLNYLAPMLENAGANTYMPRERDTNEEMYIIDNDGEGFELHYKNNSQKVVSGWKNGLAPYRSGDNPFHEGTSGVVQLSKRTHLIASWESDLIKTGKYAVYVSYPQREEMTEEAIYKVYHKDGETSFSVNQKMGGNTWIYLGHFDLDKKIKVALHSKSNKTGKFIGFDAIRVGGGLGDVEREGLVSGRARFLEAARYYMQFDGVPDPIYNFSADTLDYVDDYRSRGEWVNYLASTKRTKSEGTEGLNIPIDLSVAFHTDAGNTKKDSIIGTLMIYSTRTLDMENTFPNGKSRLSCRDLADIVQTQIVDDIRVKYDTAWTRRELWDKRYSEATYSHIPSLLLELLSHHNFYDMRFGLDPNFQFDVSRSIYKGVLKYLASQNKTEYVVQPLAPQQFATTLKEGKALLTWKAQLDPLEETASPEGYIVYTKINDGAWDNGQLVKENMALLPIEKNKLYQYKVVAYNNGGMSFPSEVLAVSHQDKETALVVNGFTRVSAPQWVAEGSYVGFQDDLDQGVPFKNDFWYIGKQYNFDQNSKWEDDDQPGHGASFSNYETKVISGNTFEHTVSHAKALHKLGYSVVSASQESVEQGKVQLSEYFMVDFLFGEQRTTLPVRDYHEIKYTIFTTSLKSILSDYLEKGGRVFMTGAYIGSDLFMEPHSMLRKEKEHEDAVFGREVLHFNGRTNHADQMGVLESYDNQFKNWQNIQYQITLSNDRYAVESSDGIDPIDDFGKSFIRYKSNSISAGVIWENKASKMVVVGFPFESIVGEEQQQKAMSDVVNYLTKDDFTN